MCTYLHLFHCDLSQYVMRLYVVQKLLKKYKLMMGKLTQTALFRATEKLTGGN